MYVRAKCRLLLHVDGTPSMLYTICTIIISIICLADKSVGNQLMTPIQNFEPSWTASSAGGTTIAIPFALKDIACAKDEQDSNSDAVLLIFRSTIPSALSSNADGVKRTKRLKSAFTLSGLRIFGSIYANSDDIPLNRSSKRWTLLGSAAICSMTGFAPDIDYLTRYLQKMIDNHRTTYESTSISMTSFISPMKLVESLAEELQEAGQWQGGRPFGVQILLVGPDPTVKKPSALGIFTLDPDGGYRRWRGGAVIGRNGKIIRDRLLDCWISRNHTDAVLHENGVDALSSGLQAEVLSRIEESENLERSDMYEAILVWQVNNECCVARINPDQINDMRNAILDMNKAKSIKNG